MKKNCPLHESLCGTGFVTPLNINFAARRQPIVSYTTRPPYRQANEFPYLQSRCGWYCSRSGHWRQQIIVPFVANKTKLQTVGRPHSGHPTIWAATDWLLVKRMFRRCISRYGTVRAVTRPRLPNIWHACPEWDAEIFPSHATFTVGPYTAVKLLYTYREMYVVLTGYLSLGRRPGNDWANTWQWTEYFTVFFW
jgi:hypothetical protein